MGSNHPLEQEARRQVELTDSEIATISFSLGFALGCGESNDNAVKQVRDIIRKFERAQGR